MKKQVFHHSGLISFVIGLVFLQKITAQSVSYPCGAPSLTLAGPSQPTNCVYFLNDFVPNSSDRTIEVNVNFWIFIPTTNSLTSLWTFSNSTYGNHITTQADVQACIDQANTTFSSMPAPNVTVSGVSSITNTKIKLTLKTFSYVPNDYGYMHIGAVANGSIGYGWHDPNAINIFLGSETYTYVATNTLTSPPTTFVTGYTTPGSNYSGASWPGIYPENYVVFNPQLVQNVNCCWDNIASYGSTLAHEIGHMLGLNHTTGDNTTHDISAITPTFGCCSFISAEDIGYDDGTFNPCPGPPFYGSGSNNVMSQNSACGYKYLSPQQAAIMHYSLRTLMKDVLSSNGYTAATNVDQNFNIEINSTQTWENGDRYVKGNITVKSGKTLTIKCGVAMTKYAKITIEKGAQLVIDGGHITNISGTTWEGVHVMGDISLSQLTSHSTNTGAAQYQGMLRIKNGGKISNANVGARNNTGSGYDAGGIIIADNALFENNFVDVEFNKIGVIPPAYPSASKFINTTFKTTGFVNTNQTPVTHARIIKIDGVKFLGCTFQFTTSLYANAGNGITSTDAIYTVDNFGAYPSIFEGLMKGILVNNINPLKVPVITNTKFVSPRSCGAYWS